MTRRRVAAVIAAALLVTLAAASCSDGADEAERSTTSTSAATTTTTAPPEPTTVELLDPGAEPRREVRFRLTAGEQVRATMTVDLAIDQEADGQSQRLDSPPVDQELLSTVLEADEDGAEIELEVLDATIQRDGSGLSTAEADEVEAQVASLAGSVTTMAMDPLGITEVLDVRAPDGADDELAASIDDLVPQLSGISLVLPSEPIGVGGRWRTTSTRTVGGIEQTLTTEFEVTELDGDVIAYTAEVEVTADEQEIDGGRLLSLAATGTGTGRLTLTTLEAEQEGRTTVEQVLEVPGPDGEPVRLEQRVTTAVVQRPEAD